MFTLQKTSVKTPKPQAYSAMACELHTVRTCTNVWIQQNMQISYDCIWHIPSTCRALYRTPVQRFSS